MKNVHVRLEYEEALTGKKELLSIEISLLELLKKLKNFSLLRKRELILKNELKNRLSDVKTKFKGVKTFFPIEEEQKIQEVIKEEKFHVAEKGNIEAELESIKEKLAALG